MLMVVVSVFFICNILALVVNILESVIKVEIIILNRYVVWSPNTKNKLSLIGANKNILKSLTKMNSNHLNIDHT